MKTRKTNRLPGIFFCFSPIHQPTVDKLQCLICRIKVHMYVFLFGCGDNYGMNIEIKSMFNSVTKWGVKRAIVTCSCFRLTMEKERVFFQRVRTYVNVALY